MWGQCDVCTWWQWQHDHVSNANPATHSVYIGPGFVLLASVWSFLATEWLSGTAVMWSCPHCGARIVDRWGPHHWEVCSCIRGGHHMLCAATSTAACLLGSLSPEATDDHPWHRLHTTQAYPTTDSSTNLWRHAKVSWSCCPFSRSCHVYSELNAERYQLYVGHVSLNSATLAILNCFAVDIAFH